MASLLFVLALIPAGAKTNQHVFFLMDSNFVVLHRIESQITSEAGADSAQVLKAAKADSSYTWWQVGSKPVSEVWLAFLRPADPGEVMFVSHTKAPVPLLRLNMDAMCGDCMRMESFYGKMTVPPNVKFDNRNLTITDLKSDFPESLRNHGLGLPLTEEEKIKIAEKVDDFTSRPESFSLEIQVLKRRQSIHVPSDDFKYIIYYVITSDLTNAIRMVGKNSKLVPPAKAFAYLLNGRRVEGSVFQKRL